MEEKKVILYDSPEAATYRTDITGWVSREGLYFGKDEDLARYSGATHKRCACGNIFEKCWVICEDCRRAEKKKREAEKLAKMKSEAWDGQAPLYYEPDDRYLFDGDEVDELCDDEGKSFNEMQFRLCKPNHPRLIEADDFHDDLPEDGEIPDELVAAIEKFNEAAKDVVLSWSPVDVLAVEDESR